MVLSGSVVLAACGNDGLSLARQACVQVNESIKLYTSAQHQTDPARAADLVRRATQDLETALQVAAQANSADPQWNPLMTTLQEIGRNSEHNLIPALRAQCTQAAQPNEQAPVIPPQPSGSVGPATPGRTTPSTLTGQ